MAGAAKLSFQLVHNPFFRLPESKPFAPQYCCFREGPFKTLQKRRRSSHSLSRSPTSSSFSLVEAEEQSLSFTDPETDLLEALLGIQGRGRAASPKQLEDVENAVQVLEDLKGVPEPTSSELIEGRWQLIFTTRPGTASPIQRTFVGVDFFKVFQEVYLKTDDQRVSNIVKFSDAIGELKVEAAATIKDGNRILFQFDRAAFSFKFLPFKVPYPVPFRLLGDEAKGWLDTTYLSHTGNIRISRGNKGTTFVLQKICEPRQRLLEAISTGFGIEEIVDELVSLRKKDDKGCDENLEGEWKLLWTSQLVDQNWEGIAADGLRGLQIVKKNGQLDNLVDVFPGLRYCARGHLVKTSERDTYSVTMSTGFAAVGGLKFTVEINNTYTLKLLYNDGKIRINRGNQDIMFVHLRVG